MSPARVFLIELTHVREVIHCWILWKCKRWVCACVCTQYLRGESGNENNLSLIRTRSLCCPGHAWHLWPSLGSTFALYSRAGPWSYASPYNWFASVPKSTHKATPDFTRFLFKEKRWHRQQETVVIYHLQFLTRIFRGEKERNSGWSHGTCSETHTLSLFFSLVLPFFLLFTWFLP